MRGWMRWLPWGLLLVGWPTGASGVVLVPNLDDDDEDGLEDWLQGDWSRADDDVHVLSVVPGALISVSGDDWAVRGRAGGRQVVGQGLPPWTVPVGGALLVVDVGAFSVLANVRVETRGQIRDLEIRGADLVLPHPLLPLTEVHVAGLRWSEDQSDNERFVGQLRRSLSIPLRVRGTWDEGGRWLQDEYEIGWARGDSSELEVILGHEWNGAPGEDPWSDLRLGPDRATLSRGILELSAADGYGNVEVSPPIPGFPDGRVLLGLGPDGLPGDTLMGYLTASARQTPLVIDTSWLCVGHVDEVVSFVPDVTAPRGFVALIPDPKAGLALIDGLDPTHSLAAQATRLAEPTSSVRARATVGELAGDRALRALNEELAAGPLAELRDQLQRELGLQAGEIVGLPLLFDDQPSWEQGLCGASSIWPSPINALAVASRRETTLFMGDPRMRGSVQGLASDPVAMAIEASLPAVEIIWMDTWAPYHLRGGEVHCATNVRRRWPER